MHEQFQKYPSVKPILNPKHIAHYVRWIRECYFFSMFHMTPFFPKTKTPVSTAP
jgi:hypothetical protein